MCGMRKKVIIYSKNLIIWLLWDGSNKTIYWEFNNYVIII